VGKDLPFAIGIMFPFWFIMNYILIFWMQSEGKSKLKNGTAIEK
jgi:hypothetical protein